MHLVTLGCTFYLRAFGYTWVHISIWVLLGAFSRINSYNYVKLCLMAGSNFETKMFLTKGLKPEFKSVLEEKSFKYAMLALKIKRTLNAQREYHLGDQFYRSATSVGANIAEAGYASSRADFINKLKIASKELNESIFWLQLFRESNFQLPFDEILHLSLDIRRIMNKSIQTATENNKK